MKNFLLSLCIVVSASGAFAEAPIVTTIINAVPGTTNYVDIPAGQAARVSALTGAHTLGYGDPSVLMEKDGVIFQPSVTYVYQGPVRFLVIWRIQPALLTLERWPIVDADQVLKVPQSSNTVSVTMQSSTDLVKWSTATNGVYSTPEGARFFRLRVVP